MDISYWTQLNRNIKFEHTQKQFFGQYLYRLAVYAPGGRLIDHKVETVEQALHLRRTMNRSYNYGGSWRDRYDHKYLNDTDVQFLELIRTIKKDYATKVRLRIDEPSINIYANDLDLLKEIVDLFSPKEHKYIESLTYPANDDAVKKLEAGAILRKTAHEYSHKVMLRDGRYDPNVKEQVLNYLDNLGDLIKISKGSREMLSKTYPSMWGVFFYTNDPSLVTFLSLIHPTLVSNIHELIHTEQ